MIRDVLDVALVLTDALNKAVPSDEAQAGLPRTTSFAKVLPPTAVFLVRTVEGAHFRVTITQEPPEL